MDLREAYVELELPIGAGEEAVREARKTLAKVWHPDRHANDPKLQKKAEAKLAEINTAFELIRAAKFPASIPEPARARATPRPAATPPPGPSATPPPPPAQSTTEFVPTRRVRWSVVLLLVGAIGAGTYFAIVKLGAKSSQAEPKHDPITTPETTPDAVVIVSAEPDAATAEDPPAQDAAVAPNGPHFSLGSTKDQVRAAQGEPDKVMDALGIWSYGFSNVTFRKHKVVGYWDVDGNLNVELVPGDAAAAAKAKAVGTYGIGATKDDVIGVEGTPNQIESVIDEQWHYGRASYVSFDGRGNVKGWSNFNNELHVRK